MSFKYVGLDESISPMLYGDGGGYSNKDRDGDGYSNFPKLEGEFGC